MSQKPRLIWNGDATVPTGFARVTHHILDTLRATFDVHVLGISYDGDPHAYPYPIYPAMLGGDSWGLGRIGNLATRLRPDLIVVQNDPWNIADYVAELKALGVPMVGYMPVDGDNCQGHKLNGLASALFYTEHGRQQAHEGGYTGRSGVVGLGVDAELYAPRDRQKARELMGLGAKIPPEAFIVGNVNRNQPRKRLDLTMAYFAEWIKTRNVRDAYLYLHVAPTGDAGWDIGQLAAYYGIAHRVIHTRRPHALVGLTEDNLAWVYNAFDVQISTTQGEGWGLCTMEGMACGIPQIVPAWSALREWARGSVYYVQCSNIAVTPKGINVIGGIADREEVVNALDTLYRDRTLRQELSTAGRAHVQRPAYRWPAVGQAFASELNTVLGGTHEATLNIEGAAAVAQSADREPVAEGSAP